MGERFRMRPHPRRKDIRRDADTNRGWIWMDGWIRSWMDVDRICRNSSCVFSMIRTATWLRRKNRIRTRPPLRGSPLLYLVLPDERKHPTIRIEIHCLNRLTESSISTYVENTRKRRIRRWAMNETSQARDIFISDTRGK